MVTQGNGIIAHVLHDVYNILSVGERSRKVALQEVSRAHQSHVAGVGSHDGIAQSAHLGVTVDAAMHVVLIKDNDTFLRLDRTYRIIFGYTSR